MSARSRSAVTEKERLFVSGAAARLLARQLRRDRDVSFEIAAHEVGIGAEEARHARPRAIIGP